MVAQRKGNTISKAIIHLIICIIICGCDSSNTKTIVTLHHTTPTSIEDAIQSSLEPDIKHSITESEIVFFASQKDIKGTLELLHFLDTGPALYQLQFKSLNKNNYSTHPAPNTLTLLEGQYAYYNQKNKINRYKIKRRNKQQSLLTIETQSKNSAQNQFILMDHNKWIEIQPATLNKKIMIKIDIIEDAPATQSIHKQ